MINWETNMSNSRCSRNASALRAVGLPVMAVLF